MTMQLLSMDQTPIAATPVTVDAQPLAHSFLQRLLACTHMSGAALLAHGATWLAMAGHAPPTGISPDLLQATGLVTNGDSPAVGTEIIVPIPVIDENQPRWLYLWDSHRHPATAANLLFARVTELVAHAAMARRRAAEIHRQHLVERASATARIGIWSCTLPDEILTWSDGIYDLFELPRGIPVDRAQTLKMYTPESAERMQVLRAQAIATLGDFNFDAEIITATGKRRWMRITATVDGVDGRARRIFGMKQNITEEKLLAERTRRLAETDSLTGLANRAQFQARLDQLHGGAGRQAVGALLLVDLDHFKTINDELGHAHGDACLIEAAKRLTAACPPGTTVARIGGDEFAIIADDDATLDAPAICRAIVDAFNPPFILAGQGRQIGASIGMAKALGHDADRLYRDADFALYQAKSAGRGTWRAYGAA